MSSPLPILWHRAVHILILTPVMQNHQSCSPELKLKSPLPYGVGFRSKLAQELYSSGYYQSS